MIDIIILNAKVKINPPGYIINLIDALLRTPILHINILPHSYRTDSVSLYYSLGRYYY